MCLLAKRLERGRFVWPRTEGEAVTITPARLGYLMEEVGLRLPERTWRPQAAGGCDEATRANSSRCRAPRGSHNGA